MNYFYANRKDKILCFILYFEEFLNSPEAISQHLCIQICKHPWVYLSRWDQCFFLLNHSKSTWQHLLLLLLLRPASLRELPHIWLRKSFRIYPRSGRFSVLSYLEQFPHGVALHPTLPLLRTNHLSLLQGQEWYNSVWEPGLLRQEKLAVSSLVLSDKRGHWGHFW